MDSATCCNHTKNTTSLLTSREGCPRADPSPPLFLDASGDACRGVRRADDPRRLDRPEPGPWAAAWSPSDAAGVACVDTERRRLVRTWVRLCSA